jgi:hypothetical protein
MKVAINRLPRRRGPFAIDWRLTLINALVGILLICSSAAGSAMPRRPAALDAEPLPSIRVDVFAPPGMKASSVDRICAETDAIWRPTGITFRWHRVTPGESASGSGLKVAIENRRLEAAGRTALGWIMFTGSDPQTSIHLSIAGAEDLLARSDALEDTVPASQQRLIERALGRALSHELGHYLLASKAHTSHGLMRASWPPRQIFAKARHGFELTTEERQIAVQRLRSDGAS